MKADDLSTARSALEERAKSLVGSNEEQPSLAREGMVLELA